MHRKMVVGSFLIVSLSSVLVAAGCDRRSGTRGANSDVQINIPVAPRPPAVGPAQVTVRLKDKAGTPIADARVEVEGDMSHAGMVPVFADALGGESGRYITQAFEFTMAGDWFIIVRATLADGRVVEQTFDLKGVEGTASGH